MTGNSDHRNEGLKVKVLNFLSASLIKLYFFVIEHNVAFAMHAFLLYLNPPLGIVAIIVKQFITGFAEELTPSSSLNIRDSLQGFTEDELPPMIVNCEVTDESQTITVNIID